MLRSCRFFSINRRKGTLGPDSIAIPSSGMVDILAAYRGGDF